MGSSLVFKCSICDREECSSDTNINPIPDGMSVLKMNLDVLNSASDTGLALSILHGRIGMGMHLSNIFFICNTCMDKLKIIDMAETRQPAGKMQKELNELLALHNCKYYPPAHRSYCDRCSKTDENTGEERSGFLLTDINFSFDLKKEKDVKVSIHLCPDCQKDLGFTPRDISDRLTDKQKSILLYRAAHVLIDKLNNNLRE
jgi:hypothetical protein